jgi:hypothetical protein
MIKRTLAVLALASLALLACDQKPSTPAPDPKAQQKRAAIEHDAQFEADLATGRIEVMQEQTRRGLQLLGATLAPLVEQPTDRETYRRLYDAVERYNELNRAACTGIAPGDFCGPAPFLPLWYAGRARPDTSPIGLKAMAEEMQNKMIPLWDAVCTKAKAKSGDEHFCAIE